MPRIMRSAAVAAVLGSATVLLATCHLGELISPPPVGPVTISISHIIDSAAVGSIERRVIEIAVATPGERAASWTATSARESAWLSLSGTSGTASGSITATLRPDNLPIGVYLDTILFRVGGGSAILTPLPVQYTIHPCSVTDISPDTALADSISTASCTAPWMAQRFASVFGFTATAGDSVSISLASSDFDAYVVLDSTTDGVALPLAEADTCLSTQGDPCLIYVLLADSGRYFIGATTARERETGAFSLQISSPREPGEPSYLAQFMPDSVTELPLGGGVSGSSLVVKAVLDDPDMTDSLRLQVEVQPVDSAFSGNPSATSGAVAVGDTAVLELGGLGDDTEYRWLARAVDQTGRESGWISFGANPTDSADFRVSMPNPPNPPGQLQQYRSDAVTVIPVGQATPERSVVLDGILTDPDLSDSLRLEVEVRPVGVAFTGIPSGSSVLTGNGERALVSIPGLDDDTGYHWQARAIDRDMNTSEWIQFGGNPETEADFGIAVPEPPYVPVYLRQLRADGTTPIAVGDTVEEATVIHRATVNDLDPGDLLRLQTETRPIGMPFTGFPTDSSTQVGAGATVSITVADLPDDTSYHWRARVTDQNGNGSVWVSFGDNADGDVDFAIAVPASGLGFATQPSDVRYGATFQPPIAVKAVEPSGATDTSFTGPVTLAIAPNTGADGAVLSGTTVKNAVLGVARFHDLTIDLVASGYVLTATSPGLPSVNSVSFDVLPGSAGRLGIVVQPSPSAQSGVVLAQQPAVQVQDSDGHPVALPGLTITADIASGPSGATLSSATAVSDIDGLATFAGLTLEGPVGDYVLRFLSPGLLPVVSQIITLDPGPADPGSTTALVPGGVAGRPTTIVVTVRDASGNPLSGGGEEIAVSVTGANVLDVVRVEDNGDSTYTATYTPIQVGTDSISITLASQPISGSPYTSVVTTLAPSQMSVYDGDNQTAVVGTPVPVQPAVLVTDDFGNSIEGVPVSFTVTAGAGSVSPTSPVLTDAAGIARVQSWTLGPISGINQLSATTAVLTASPVVFTATGTPGAPSPSQSEITATPDTIAADGSISTITVTARDAYGNAVPDADVVLAVTGTGNALTQPAGPTDASGQATGTLSSTVAETKIVSATVAGTGISQTATVVVTPSTASQLAIVTQPSDTAQSGVPFARQPVIQMRDINDNEMNLSGVTVTASIASGGGILGGTLSQVTDEKGIADFEQLSITGLVGPRTLRFEATGVTGVTSDTIQVSAGTVSQLAITTQPSSLVQNGSPFPRQPVIQLLDGSGNDVLQSGVVVTAAIESGAGTLGGSLSAATDARGTAAFDDLSLTGEVGDYTLRFTGSDAAAVISNIVTVTVGNASRLGITTQPSASAVNGVPFDQQPVIQLQDVSGNDVSQEGVPVTASIESGAGRVQGTLTVSSDANGVANFTNLSLIGLVGDYTLRFDASGLTSTVSGTISLQPGVATHLSITTQPPAVVQVGQRFSEQPAVELLDSGGNNVRQNKVVVTASIATGDGTLQGPLTADTDNNGAASFKNLAITGATGDYTLMFTAPGLIPVTSTIVTVTAATDLVLPSAQPSESATAPN